MDNQVSELYCTAIVGPWDSFTELTLWLDSCVWDGRHLRRPEKEWVTKDTEDRTIAQAGDTKGDTVSIPGQANGAAGVSKSPPVWSESVLTALSPSFICPAWT